MCLAERGGFEPPISCDIHAFQACALGHYATSPNNRWSLWKFCKNAKQRWVFCSVTCVWSFVSFVYNISLFSSLYETVTFDELSWSFVCIANQFHHWNDLLLFFWSSYSNNSSIEFATIFYWARWHFCKDQSSSCIHRCKTRYWFLRSESMVFDA